MKGPGSMRLSSISWLGNCAAQVAPCLEGPRLPGPALPLYTREGAASVRAHEELRGSKRTNVWRGGAALCLRSARLLPIYEDELPRTLLSGSSRDTPTREEIR